MENWLVKRAKLDPKKIALILEHADFTFSELNSTVQLFAGKLYSRGIRQNDPVALFTDNCFNGYVAILALQQLDGNIIGPKILGNRTGLSSFWVLFAIVLFGGLWGVPGMVICVPVFAVIYNTIKRLVRRGLHKKGQSQIWENYKADYPDETRTM